MQYCSYNRAYGNKALPKMVSDITANNFNDNTQIILGALSDLKIWVRIPENACQAVQENICLDLAHIIDEKSDFRRNGVLRVFINLAKHPIGKKHIISSDIIDKIARIISIEHQEGKEKDHYENNENNESRGLSLRLAAAISQHPSGARSIIDGEIFENLANSLPSESLETTTMILSTMGNISRFFAAEFLSKYPQCIQSIASFLDTRIYGSTVAHHAATILADLSTLDEAKQIAIDSNLIESLMECLCSADLSRFEEKELAKRALCCLNFLAITVEGKKGCILAGLTEHCEMLIEQFCRDSTVCERCLIAMVLNSLALLAEDPENRHKLISRSDSVSQSSLIRNLGKLEKDHSECQWIGEPTRVALEVLHWKP